MDGDERAVLSLLVQVVDRLGEHLLTGAGFALQKHCDIANEGCLAREA